ncbi:SDR family oxidoreductase [Nocardia otitidiscaviarum]|uniref:SDR family oxidoreductase n=1 Tax=Nocardia otitidiscaviarum TaxID=1823 RepID=UPI0004A6EF70|nr:SDR family oxidoreductase [Nocardia otitidiscaviarum]MBF6133674.1 SDR family oxidoreductase [Nocardia otitidiscaviarum]MBF6235635.1 SDR family oxidoreductase [Nocardia otitidiscaviarum]MBF6487702.1 SDR family oxidoreductase [Nocardia otitidiscaviarum]
MSTATTIAGKVVVITGGARGIGYATARTLRDLGALVAIGDVDEAKVKESGADLGLEVYGTLDVTDPDSFTAFLDEVERRLGPLDVLVNNAGIMPAGRFADEPDRVTRRILDINVYGVVLGSKLAAQRMLPRGRGHIINIASLAGEAPTPGLVTYCASKAAVLQLTEALRLENRDSGVHFSAVAPTFTNTELIAGTQGAKGLRNAEPQDIADAVAGLIAKPRHRVSVTRVAGALVHLQYFLPRTAKEFLGRAFGLEHVFTDEVDQDARRAYEQRARGED